MPGRDAIAGLTCLAISIALLFLTRGLPPAVMVPIGPAFYPRVVLSFMAVLSALLVVMDMVSAHRRRRAPTSQPMRAKPAGQPNYRLVTASFIAFGLYIAVLPGLGFRIATVLFMLGLQVLLEWPHSWKRWMVVLLVATGTTVICYAAFERCLLILLPRGVWTGM